MGSHVDSFLKEAKQKEKDNGQKTSKIAATVRQVYNERKELVGKTDSNKGKKKDFSI
jgi:hypothetical protein